MDQKQKIRIMKMDPCTVLVQYPESGKVIKHPRRFFSKRLEMGLWEVENPSSLPKPI